MFVADDRVIYSASDLAAAARCEYALLRSFDAQLGWGPPVAAEDELLARTAKLGGEHEQRHLDELADDVGGHRRRHRPARLHRRGLTAAAEATLRAVERRAPVIYQAAMFDGRFVGFADFLVFDGAALPAARHQAGPVGQGRGAASARGLRRHAGRGRRAGGDEVELVLGDGATVSYRVDELIPVYRPRRADCSACSTITGRRHRGEVGGRGRARLLPLPGVHDQVRAHDDLLLVAGMRVSQRARLIDAGITTMTDLAHHDGPVAELSAEPSPR